MEKEIIKYYQKYKVQLLPVIFFSLTFFLIFRVILSQFSSVAEIKTSIESKQREISKLQSSLDTLNSQDETVLDQDVKTVSLALPNVKDITVMFLALTSASSKSNVELKGFSLKVGGVYGKSSTTFAPSVSGVPALSVSVHVATSNPANLVLFTKELQQKLPLSEVKTIDAQSTQGNLEVNFYYKPYDLAVFAKQDKIVPLTASERKILSQLKSWE